MIVRHINLLLTRRNFRNRECTGIVPGNVPMREVAERSGPEADFTVDPKTLKPCGLGFRPLNPELETLQEGLELRPLWGWLRFKATWAPRPQPKAP